MVANGLIGAITAIAMASGAQAQTSGSGTSEDVRRAFELENSAAVAQTDSRRWSQAAAMLREASRLRPENDPVALMDLRTAGAIYGTIGDLQRAKKTMLELAERAEEFGEIATAAHAFMDAAHVALRLEDPESVRRFYSRAQRLAMSSHLTSDERRVITVRLERSPTLFASAAR
jgi:hypothetical protein